MTAHILTARIAAPIAKKTRPRSQGTHLKRLAEHIAWTPSTAAAARIFPQHEQFAHPGYGTPTVIRLILADCYNAPRLMKRDRSRYFFDSFTRSQWARFGAAAYRLSAEALSSLKGINEPMVVAEVDDIIGPLCRLIDLQIAKESTHPFVIAVSGSVAVGKSTFSRVLRAVLAQANRTVELVATDGFLWPTRVLEERRLMGRKGFPESYDLESMLSFLADLKAGKSELRVPVYSHELYDIVPEQFQPIVLPEVLIFEGLNVLQGSRDNAVVAADYFDFSIYLDADQHDIEQWYVERFSILQRTVFQRPTSYFHHYKDLRPSEVRRTGREIWRTINLPNLLQNIQPTRERASVILRKSQSHAIEEVLWRHSLGDHEAFVRPLTEPS